MIQAMRSRPKTTPRRPAVATSDGGMPKTVSASQMDINSPSRAAIHTRDLSTTNEKKSVITGSVDTKVDKGHACNGS